MSVLDTVDPGSRAVLERYRFDPTLFSELQARVAEGTLSPTTNAVDESVEPPSEEELVRLPRPGDGVYEQTREAGLQALRRGEVAAAVLNGGMATRFGGLVKGIVDAVDGRSFLECKLVQADAVARAVGAEISFAVMNSFATDEATRAFVASKGLGEPLFFTQSVSLRLEPDGSLFRNADGSASPYSPGHGDFGDSLRSSGVLARLRERGVRVLTLSNVDNLGARVDPVVLGVHLLEGRPMTAEIAPKEPGDVGGAPARVNGRTQIVEGFRFPPGFDQDRIRVFATNSFVFDLDALDRSYPLTWLYVEKQVEARPAVQLERLVNELSAFLPTTFLEVPRAGTANRFLPVKTPEDLVAAREPVRQLLALPPLG